MKETEHKRARRAAWDALDRLDERCLTGVEEALRQGTVVRALASTISGCRKAYQHRVPKEIQDAYDYFTGALILILRQKRKALTGSESPPADSPDAEFETAFRKAAASRREAKVAADPPAAGSAVSVLEGNVLLSGRIHEEFLADLIQQISASMETGTLRIFPDPERKFEIYLVHGEVYDCVSHSPGLPGGKPPGLPKGKPPGLPKGKPAFTEAIQMEEGTYEFELTGNDQIERTIHGQTAFLVLEAFKQQDSLGDFLYRVQDHRFATDLIVGVPRFKHDRDHKIAGRIASAMLCDLEDVKGELMDGPIRQGRAVEGFQEVLADLRFAYEHRVSPHVQAEYDYFTAAQLRLLRAKRLELVGRGDAPPGSPDQLFEELALAALAEQSGDDAETAEFVAASGEPEILVTGRLYKQFLPDLIQQLCNARQTGILRVPAGAEGEPRFEAAIVRGELFDCTGPSSRGKDAFIELLRLADGTYEFELKRDLTPERTMEETLGNLIVEALT